MLTAKKEAKKKRGGGKKKKGRRSGKIGAPGKAGKRIDKVHGKYVYAFSYIVSGCRRKQRPKT